MRTEDDSKRDLAAEIAERHAIGGHYSIGRAGQGADRFARHHLASHQSPAHMANGVAERYVGSSRRPAIGVTGRAAARFAVDRLGKWSKGLSKASGMLGMGTGIVAAIVGAVGAFTADPALVAVAVDVGGWSFGLSAISIFAKEIYDATLIFQGRRAEAKKTTDEIRSDIEWLCVGEAVGALAEGASAAAESAASESSMYAQMSNFVALSEPQEVSSNIATLKVLAELSTESGEAAKGFGNIAKVLWLANIVVSAHDFFNPIMKALDRAGAIAKAGWKSASDTAVGAGHWIAGRAKAVWDWGKHTAVGASHWLTDNAKGLWNWSGQAVRGAEQLASDTVHSLITPPAAHDGALTGPFFPVGDQRANRPYSEKEKRALILSGEATLFVNGIKTTEPEHCRAAARIADQTKGPVVGIYNATSGGFRDTIQALADKFNDLGGNPATRTLTGLIVEAGGRRLKIEAHSQGSIIVSEALRQARIKLNKEHLQLGKDIDVTTWGNAAWTFPAGPTYHHRIHGSDAVPTFLGTGSFLTKWIHDSPRLQRAAEWYEGGPIDDSYAHTRALHYGGVGFEPHHLDETSHRDYLDDRRKFEDAEKHAQYVSPGESMKETGRALIDRPLHDKLRSVGASAGHKANQLAWATAGGYGAMDRAIRGMPSVPFLPPNTLWGAADRAIRWGGAHAAQFLGISPKAGHPGKHTSPRLQRSGAGDHPDVDPQDLRTSLIKEGGTGFAPGTNVRSALGGHLGFDPGGARLHRGPAAAAAARELKAEAFTVGQDVFFGSESYDPGSSKGLGLLAHELTHVGQQTGTLGDKARFYSQQGGDAMEEEARDVAERVVVRAGRSDGLVVDEYIRSYEPADGPLTPSDHTHLDRISLAALDFAEQELRDLGLLSQSGVLNSADVAVSLDLSEMTDTDAAAAWGTAIVDAVRRGASRAGPSAVDDRIQKWDSFEHVALGDEVGGGRLIVLDCYKRDLPDHAHPEKTRSWPSDWQEFFAKMDSDQKRALQKGLTTGEIHALSGDFYASFDDLNKGSLREIIKLVALIRRDGIGKRRATTGELQDVTGGRYLALAKRNVEHFSQHEASLNRWKCDHLAAIQQMIAASRLTSDGEKQAAETRAYAMDAAASHFLEDAFASGHVAAPRSDLWGGPAGDITSMVIHNVSNERGLTVTNRKGESWTAFGDDALASPGNEENRNRLIGALKSAHDDIERAMQLGDRYAVSGNFAVEDMVPMPPSRVQKPTARQVAADAMSGLGELFAADDTRIRKWVRENNSAVADIAFAEKLRLLLRLTDGSISKQDADAAATICDTITDAEEMATIRMAVGPKLGLLSRWGSTGRVRKAISRTVQGSGTSSAVDQELSDLVDWDDKQIREWVRNAPAGKLPSLALHHKVRMCVRLAEGRVTEADASAFEAICNTVSNPSDMDVIRNAVFPVVYNWPALSQASRRVTAALKRQVLSPQGMPTAPLQIGPAAKRELTGKTLAIDASKQSPNFNARVGGKPVSTIVLHATASKSLQGTVAWFENPQSQVSAHYVVGKDGSIENMVPVSSRAWHAGISSGPDGSDVNTYSVGIEIVNLNDGSDPYPPVQVQAVTNLCENLVADYPTIRYVVAHFDIAPDRKSDPKGFPVDQVAQQCKVEHWKP